MLEDVFFDGWAGLARTLVVGVMAYVVLIVFLRISGKRTLSKMNAFDLIVTVALGSTLATVLLSKDVALAEGALAFAVLIGLQFIVTWSSVRARWVRRLVTGEPRLLYYQGRLLPQALLGARVTVDEIEAAVRSSGMANLAQAASVILETDGSFSVIKRQDGQIATVPVGVAGPQDE
ncbi:DUF421 domain-containing protein [Halopseudomonas salina]|uniref:DUF421 domain-containing protein n=1 Tax=Halopseudomonas salina TaxID=1323744 RepID=A0ABQ1PZF6_9GAMM|nr:YetF domain-containing protein [Halopseudomonas salina]GGD07760.1 DUF421 domain-containing protein [Halopseudomonas salina]